MEKTLFDDWEKFLEVKLAVGEIYSHLHTLTGAVETWSPEKRLLAYAHFVAFYDPGTAYMVSMEHPKSHTLWWLQQNWHYIHPRAKERYMVVGSPARMFQCLQSIDEWIKTAPEKIEKFHTESARTFEDAYRLAGRIRYIGRYMQIRLARAICLKYLQHGSSGTIHAKGGKAIREPLAMLYPEELPDWKHGTSVQRAEEIGRQENIRLAERGIHLSLSEMSEMLCDFKRMVKGKNYIGLQFDDRIYGIRNVEKYGLSAEPLWDARRRYYHPAALGELQGWEEPRERLKSVYKDTGEVYDPRKYNIPKPNFSSAFPIAR